MDNIEGIKQEKPMPVWFLFCFFAAFAHKIGMIIEIIIKMIF